MNFINITGFLLVSCDRDLLFLLGLSVNGSTCGEGRNPVSDKSCFQMKDTKMNNVQNCDSSLNMSTANYRRKISSNSQT
jgi:hypothetical protein